MDQELSQDTVARERELRKKLRSQDISQRWDDALKSSSDVIPSNPSWPRWLFAALRVAPQLIFRVAITGRVPVPPGQYRWFLHQQYLSPEVTGGFVSFAARLTQGQWTEEDQGQVGRLLISSFLEDLRRAYRWRTWQLWRVRRMTYVILLLDNITRANGGYTILRLINDVRNELGRFDPLLVISASRKVPPDAGHRIPGRPQYDAAHALIGYQNWQNSLFADRRAHGDTAWYLPLSIPGVPSESERHQAEQQIGAFDGYQLGRSTARPPWWSSRILRMGVILILLAGLVGSYTTWAQAHCGGWTRFPGLSPSLEWTGTECIGVTDGSYDIFQPSDQSILQVEQVILSQNRQAEQTHAAHPERPYITLVDIDTLTSSTGSADGLTPEREALEGIAVAQQRQLQGGSTDPIVRVLVANAGLGMRQGPALARQLADLAKSDPTVVGVVGLEMSTQPTVDAISALSDAGLPMVASTLSADSLADDHHPLYFQVTPQNIREAAVAAAWADQQARATPSIPRTVRVYYSDEATDIYSTNLRDDAVKSFTGTGFQVEAKAFKPNADSGASASQIHDDQLLGSAYYAGNDTCFPNYNGFVFYAGRGLPDYDDFLRGAAQCGSKAIFLGDDDVTDYVADATEREANQTPPFYYLSFALVPSARPQGQQQNFYHELYQLFSFEYNKKQGRAMDGYAALSNDAADVLITAARYLREGSETIPITPGTVWREITDIHTPKTPQDNEPIDGVTGIIDFGGDTPRHVPLNKPVAILRVNSGEVNPRKIEICGTISTQKNPTWCPTDPDN
jgi:ABC-type branched-subunit amino acid transport system substrate-binding protein